MEGTSELGTGFSVVAPATVSPTGLQATGVLNGVTVDLLIEIPVTGLSATSEIGTAFVVEAATNVYPTGLSATGEVGRVLICQNIDPSQNPNWINMTPSQTPNWTSIP